MKAEKTIGFWRGEKIEELDKPVLLDIIEHLGDELESIRRDRRLWMKSGNALDYMVLKNES